MAIKNSILTRDKEHTISFEWKSIDGGLYLRNYIDDTLIGTYGQNQNLLASIDYAEITTRNGNTSSKTNVNTNFFDYGYLTVSLIGKCVHIVGQGKSTKNSPDWVIQMLGIYRPYKIVYFNYYLGNIQHTGHISGVDNSTSSVYFDTLNNSDLLNFHIAYNMH